MVGKAMAGSASRNKVIFADACFSGRMRDTDGVAGWEAEARKGNVMLFLSSRSDERSIERGFMQNGYFTSYLQKGLRGGADANRDRVITAREIFDYVHGKVAKTTKGAQHPVMWGQFPDGMPVMKW